MSSRTAGVASGAGSTRWKAVAVGWVAAALAGVVINPILRLLYGLLAEPPIERGEFTLAVVVVSLVSGFLSYLVGGYVAAKMARYSGGKHGAMTAIFGLVIGAILGIILAPLGFVFVEGVAAPPVGFGLAGTALIAGLILFLVNLFGGFVGGKLGEPAHPEAKRLG